MTRSLCLALVTFASLPTQADIMPEGQKRVGYTYEITNLQARPDLNIVLWPRSCGSDGTPEGKLDLALNPQYAAHMHDVDYEVVRSGCRHNVGKFCEETSRFYGLAAQAFPSVHDILALEPDAAGTLKLVPRFLVYQFTDGKQERIAYTTNGRRPTASRR